MVQLYSLTSEATKEIDEKRRRGLFLSVALWLVEFGALSAVFGFLFFTIAVKGLFYGKSGMATKPQFEIVG